MCCLLRQQRFFYYEIQVEIIVFLIEVWNFSAILSLASLWPVPPPLSSEPDGSDVCANILIRRARLIATQAFMQA